MALRQATQALPWTLLRAPLCGSISHAASGAGALSAGRSEEEDHSQAHGMRPAASSPQAHALAQQHSMSALAPHRYPLMGMPRLFSTATQRSSPLGLMSKQQQRTPLGLSLPALSAHSQAQGSVQQRRSINAWSPAQRYFVEGDHVVQAEANRAFQFTGLDSGSFYPMLIYTVVAAAVAGVFVVLPLVVAPSRVDLDKSSAYECGFDAFGEARQTFSVSFYLVSIMYLLFDIEIAYLFPYVMTHANTPMFWTMNLFLGILVAGFVYEWGVGALEWRDSEAD